MLNNKLLAVMLSLVLVAGLGGQAFAQSPITIPPEPGDSSNISTPSSNDNTVYDNGPHNAGAIGDLNQRVFADDFVLSEDTTITDLHFFTTERSDEWDGTVEYFFFEHNAIANEPGNLITSDNAIMIQKTLLVSNPFGNTFEYSADLQTPLELDGGTTYWIGFHTKSDFTVGAGGFLIGRTNQLDGNVLHFTPTGGAIDSWNVFAANDRDIAFSLTGHPTNVVGGELLPIETTSLILAGAQSFSWMIPVVLSVLGIGLFVVSRKS